MNPASSTSRHNHTRQRLLDAACSVFALKGYRQATVSEICRRARANIAAVNYHFGGKAALYRESWRYAHQRMLEKFPPDGGVPAHAPPTQRLRGRIRAILQCSLAPQNPAVRIMAQEMETPTGLLHEVFRDAIGPLRQAIRQLMRELLGGGCDELTVKLCEMSVITPCLHVMRARRRREDHHELLRPQALDDMVDHFTVFALAGIEEIRRRHTALGPNTIAALAADDEGRGKA